MTDIDALALLLQTDANHQHEALFSSLSPSSLESSALSHDHTPQLSSHSAQEPLNPEKSKVDEARTKNIVVERIDTKEHFLLPLKHSLQDFRDLILQECGSALPANFELCFNHGEHTPPFFIKGPAAFQVFLNSGSTKLFIKSTPLATPRKRKLKEEEIELPQTPASATESVASTENDEKDHKRRVCSRFFPTSLTLICRKPGRVTPWRRSKNDGPRRLKKSVAGEPFSTMTLRRLAMYMANVCFVKMFSKAPSIVLSTCNDIRITIRRKQPTPHQERNSKKQEKKVPTTDVSSNK
jgi:hypothetical protein